MLAIHLPTTGVLSGLTAVGDINTGFDSLQGNIAGVLSKDMTGAVDVTLSATESYNGIVSMTGAIAANINLIVPAAAMKWAVKNGTTGAYTITVKTPSGTGIVIPPNTSFALYCDGTNVYSEGGSKDSNGNVTANNFVPGFATTATAAGTTTLTASSAYAQTFTGTTTQTVALPVTSTLALGMGWRIQNQSTGAVTVQSSGLNTIVIVPAGGEVFVECVLLSGTTAASWNAYSYETRDANLNIAANNMLLGYATTATAAGTTTLVVGSAYTQVFTGSTTQTVVMPVTSTLVLGQSWFIQNQSTGAVTVQSSGANTIVTIPAGGMIEVECILITGTTAASWIGYNFAVKDTNLNITANNFLQGYTTTATAAGTTTLTVSSTFDQYFTGATTQTVTLPVTSTLVLGQGFLIHNQSTGVVTVNSSGANAVVLVQPGQRALCKCVLTSGTTAASWTGEHLVLRDGNLNVTVNNLLSGYASTATAAGTTTLTVSSAFEQTFTGSTTQTCQLPVTSTLVLGQSFLIQNQSTGVVTVNSSGSNAVASVAAGSSVLVTCILVSGTTAASWLANKYAMLDVAQAFTKPQGITPTTASSASYTWNGSTDPHLVLTASAALTMNAPSNLVDGNFYVLRLTYSGTYAVTWNTAFKGTSSLTLTSTNGAIDALVFRATGSATMELWSARMNVGV